MAQVSTTLSANTFNSHHAMTAVYFLGNGIGLSRLVKRGPSTTSVEFGG
jgi:hypothetical protein